MIRLTLTTVRKHPHVCGEDYMQMEGFSGYRETPPRVWGRPLPLLRSSVTKGNTPTCVGKTMCSMRPEDWM